MTWPITQSSLTKKPCKMIDVWEKQKAKFEVYYCQTNYVITNFGTHLNTAQVTQKTTEYLPDINLLLYLYKLRYLRKCFALWFL